MSKLRITLKDPDTLTDAIQELIHEELDGMAADEAAAVYEIRAEKYGEIASTWFEYGEYLTVVIDLDAKTIEVEKPTS